MMLTELLENLANTFSVHKTHSAPLNTLINQSAIVRHSVSDPHSNVIYINIKEKNLTLSVYEDDAFHQVAQINGHDQDTHQLALQVLAAIGHLLGTPVNLNEQLRLAREAIAVDFTTTLTAMSKLMGAPLVIVDVTGEHVLANSNNAHDEATAVSQYLEEDTPKVAIENFWHHLYLTDIKKSLIPLLLTPLAANGETLAYLAIPIVGDMLYADQLLQFAASVPTIS